MNIKRNIQKNGKNGNLKIRMNGPNGSLKVNLNGQSGENGIHGKLILMMVSHHGSNNQIAVIGLNSVQDSENSHLSQNSINGNYLTVQIGRRLRKNLKKDGANGEKNLMKNGLNGEQIMMLNGLNGELNLKKNGLNMEKVSVHGTVKKNSISGLNLILKNGLIGNKKPDLTGLTV